MVNIIGLMILGISRPAAPMLAMGAKLRARIEGELRGHPFSTARIAGSVRVGLRREDVCGSEDR